MFEFLIVVIDELIVVYEDVIVDLVFCGELVYLLLLYVGCFLVIIEVLCFVEYVGGVWIFFKCEDLNYIGFYKINNVLGQVLFIKCFGKMWVIVEIGVGQYGVVMVMVVVLFGLDCMIYMGEVDMECQVFNVVWMCLFGVEVVVVIFGF